MKNQIDYSEKGPLFIFDGMNLAHTAYHSHDKLSYKGKSVSMIYGVPEIIRAFISRYRPEEVIVVWDGSIEKRRLLFPGYKLSREHKREPKARQRFLKQIKAVRKMLYALGIPQVHNADVEGDDMVYLVHNRFRRADKNRFIRIISADKDMQQLIGRFTWVQSPRSDAPVLTNELLKAVTSIEKPEDVVDYLCLVGDSSDDIPGYFGIGPAKARAFLAKWKSISNFLSDPTNRDKVIRRKRLKNVYRRNRILIDLAYFCKKHDLDDKDITYYRARRTPVFNETKFLRLCSCYGMKRFLMPQFQAPFKNL